MPIAPVIYVEQELVRKIILCDQQAFKELFHLYYKRLCQFAFLFLHSKEVSEEVVSDVFFNIWTKREQLDPERNVRSLLYTAVRNHAIDYRRGKSINIQDNINVYELKIEDSAVDTDIDIELYQKWLQKAFDLLPDRCKIIARMHFNDALSHKEIAEILKISPYTVKAQIVIAITKIKDTFEKYGWNRE